MPRKQANASLPTIYPGRKTKPSWVTIPGWYLTPDASIVSDHLKKLRSFRSIPKALRFLKKHHPDTSQAVHNFLMLSSQGHEMEIYDLDGNRISEAEAKWRDLAARCYAVGNNGLDGLIMQLHESALLSNGMAIEVEVNQDLDDVVDIHPIDPQTLIWKKENNKLIPYQRVNGEEISLEKANFFWVPTAPDFEDPTGNPAFSALPAAADFQMQTAQDKQAVLHNQGYPRYDASINREAVVSGAPPDVKHDGEKLRNYLRQVIEDLKASYESLNPDDAFIHFDDVVVQLLGGAMNTGRGMDARAIDEGVDRMILAALKQLSAFMNRTAGTTETWSTVQFKIFCMFVKALQRSSKRLIERAAALALRVWGIQGIPKLKFDEIDDQSERVRLEIEHLRAKLAAFYYYMGWLSHEQASLLATKREPDAPGPRAMPTGWNVDGGEPVADTNANNGSD